MKPDHRTRSRKHLIGGWALLLAALVACAPAVQIRDGRPSSLIHAPPPAQVAAGPDLHLLRGSVPFPFEANRGQAPDDLGYILRAGPMQVGFAAGGLRYRLLDGTGADCADSGRPRAPRVDALDPTAACPEAVRSHTVALEMIGVAASPSGTVPSETLVSYFKGRPDEWLVGVPAFQQLAYREAWPGIDVLYERAERGLESTYVVAPGADPARIRLAWHGAEVARLAEDGALEIATPVGILRESAPVAWQGAPDGGRTPVSARLDLLADGSDGDPVEAGFRVGPYDAARPLVIDPVSGYAGYVGGSSTDVGNGIAVDAAGAAYLVGYTDSTEATFQILGGPDLTYNGGSGSRAGDAFVAKVRPDGSGLVYAGYVGGNGGEFGRGIAVDAAGAAYLVGDTNSSEATFPVLGGPDLTYNGGTGLSGDAFVAKVRPDGSGLVYAGYVGGNSIDSGTGIAIDATGAAYLVGYTYSTEASFPVLGGPDLTFNGGSADAFVAKVRTDGSGLVYAGYVGGSGFDFGEGIAVDAAGAAYLVGSTYSTEATFPVLDGPDLTFNAVEARWTDAFVAKVRSGGSGLVYAGYVGGNGPDVMTGIAIDAAGAAYLVGYTSSSEATFPVRGGPDLTYNGGGADAFVAKVRPDGSGLIYAGYVGGSGDDLGYGIAVDATGVAYLVGATFSTEATFPVVGGPDLTYNGAGQYAGGDAFVAKVRPDGSGLAYAGYVGGSSGDVGYGITVDAAGAAYLVGYTDSTEATFPVLGGPDLTFNSAGIHDAFVAKVGRALTVATNGDGTGSVTSAASGIDCRDSCTTSFPPGMQVTLTAVPSPGSAFAGWSGACAGTGTCQVTMDAEKSVTATFARSNVGVLVGRPTAPPPGSEPILTATLTARANCGQILRIQFGTPGAAFANARVSITAPAGGPSGQTTGFAYLPPPGTTSVTLSIQRVVQSGGATVSPISFSDGCGEWRTFVGGGPDAFR